MGSGCSYGYTRATTPIISAATVASQGASSWRLRLDGSFGSGGDFPLAGTQVMIGAATECVLVPASVSANSIECDAPPPLAGTHTVSLTAPAWGFALGDPTLPTIAGVPLAVRFRAQHRALAVRPRLQV